MIPNRAKGSHDDVISDFGGEFFFGGVGNNSCLTCVGHSSSGSFLNERNLSFVQRPSLAVSLDDLRRSLDDLRRSLLDQLIKSMGGVFEESLKVRTDVRGLAVLHPSSSKNTFVPSLSQPRETWLQCNKSRHKILILVGQQPIQSFFRTSNL
ncbi:hypothetical protein BC830DRAFT_1154570 [Chytriomyces sp. MP71]|nr:hypothetical protein BC830DRAFT_1154570 [Chytriomyces sp. MP71]